MLCCLRFALVNSRASPASGCRRIQKVTLIRHALSIVSCTIKSYSPSSSSYYFSCLHEMTGDSTTRRVTRFAHHWPANPERIICLMQRATPTRTPRRPGSTDTRKRMNGTNSVPVRKEGSSRRGVAGGVGSPRRRTRKDIPTITIESDTDGSASVEEIESPVFRSNTMSKRPQRAGPGVLGGILWPLRMLLSLAISIFHALLSPLLQQIMLPILGVVLAVALGILVVKIGIPYLLSNVLSLAQLPFRILWRLYQGDLHLGDLNIRNALVTIHTNMPSRLAIVGGLCQVATIPGLCTVGLLERMKSVQEADRAIVARKLQKEAQDALDVFDSVIKLGTGGVDGGLHHTKVWELATAIKVSSNLPEKFEIAYDMRQLGDLSRDLSDDISVLAAESNSVFSWTIREFDRLFHLLSDDNLSLSPRELEQRLHSVMIRIQANLDNLYHITERTIPKAEAGSALGGRIMESVSWEVDRLERGIKAEPGWKHSWEQAQRFLRGESEPSKLDILHTDLALSKLTVQNLQDLRLNLEIVRKHLRNHRNEIGLFSSGLMGFHLGFPSKEDTEPGTAAKVELNLLEEIVSEMKGALAATRQHRKGQQSDSPLEIDPVIG